MASLRAPLLCTVLAGSMLACGRAPRPPAPVPLRVQLAWPRPEHVETTRIPVQGMHCSGCEYNVASGLRLVAGVVSAEADHVAGEARIEYDPEATDVAALVQAIEDIGYRAALPAGSAAPSQPARD